MVSSWEREAGVGEGRMGEAGGGRVDVYEATVCKKVIRGGV